MTVVVDTSILVAALHAGDPHHEDGQRVLRAVLSGKHGNPRSCAHVLDEGLTLLRKRVGRRHISQAYAEMLTGREGRAPPVAMVPLSPSHMHRAVALHFEHYDRGLSYTDCVLAVLARDLQAPIATLDAGFEGLVPRIH